MGSSFRQMFAMDSAAERDGIWLRFGAGKELRCARSGGENKLFDRTLERVSKPFRRVIDAKAMPLEDMRNMLIEVFSLAIVRDWKGVVVDDIQGDGDMTPLPFSPENCQALFKALPELFDNVRDAISDASNFRAYLDKEDSGN